MVEKQKETGKTGFDNLRKIHILQNNGELQKLLRDLRQQKSVIEELHILAKKAKNSLVGNEIKEENKVKVEEVEKKVEVEKKPKNEVNDMALFKQAFAPNSEKMITTKIISNFFSIKILINSFKSISSIFPPPLFKKTTIKPMCFIVSKKTYFH